MDIRRIYEYALEREREGKRFFQENAGRLSHASAVGAFKRLADEEQKHIEFIQSLITALDTGVSNGESLVKEAAGEAGYRSLPHLCREFKKVHGITPSQAA